MSTMRDDTMRRALCATQDVISLVVDQSPYGVGPLSESEMTKLGTFYGYRILHSAFIREIENKFKRGEDIRQLVQEYLSIVFVQGFTTGVDFERDS